MIEVVEALTQVVLIVLAQEVFVALALAVIVVAEVWAGAAVRKAVA